MKIQIREKDGMHFTLLFPTALIVRLLCSRMAARLITKALQAKFSVDEQGDRDALEDRAKLPVESVLQPQIIQRFREELKDCIQKNRNLTLVEVESADGDYVKIVL